MDIAITLTTIRILAPLAFEHAPLTKRNRTKLLRGVSAVATTQGWTSFSYQYGYMICYTHFVKTKCNLEETFFKNVATSFQSVNGYSLKSSSHFCKLHICYFILIVSRKKINLLPHQTVSHQHSTTSNTLFLHQRKPLCFHVIIMISTILTGAIFFCNHNLHGISYLVPLKAALVIFLYKAFRTTPV